MKIERKRRREGGKEGGRQGGREEEKRGKYELERERDTGGREGGRGVGVYLCVQLGGQETLMDGPGVVMGVCGA